MATASIPLNPNAAPHPRVPSSASSKPPATMGATAPTVNPTKLCIACVEPMRFCGANSVTAVEYIAERAVRRREESVPEPQYYQRNRRRAHQPARDERNRAARREDDARARRPTKPVRHDTSREHAEYARHKHEPRPGGRQDSRLSRLFPIYEPAPPPAAEEATAAPGTTPPCAARRPC